MKKYNINIDYKTITIHGLGGIPIYENDSVKNIQRKIDKLYAKYSFDHNMPGKYGINWGFTKNFFKHNQSKRLFNKIIERVN